jgi:anti-sigma28 factor (negative regulator of flagellin synthesis)
LKSQLIATVKIGLWTKEACQLADETDVEERMIKVTYKGRLGTELSELIQNDKAVGQAGRDQRTEVGPTVKSAKVNTYKEAREPQKILRRLAYKDNELFAERVRQIKKLIAKGEYEVDPREVAKSIIRAEVSRHLERSRVQSMNIDLTELLALHRKRNGGGEKYVGGTWRIKRSPSQRRTSSRLPNKSMQNQA